MYVSPWSLEARQKYIVSSQNVLDKIQLFKIKNQRNLLRKLAYFKRWTQLSEFFFMKITLPCDVFLLHMWGKYSYMYFTGISMLY